MTYALSDHRRYVCAGAAGSTGAAGDPSVWWSRSGSLTVPAWALVVTALVAIGESAASAPVVTGAVLAVVTARFGYRAVLRRMGRRRVHRLTIDLDPGYHAELRRQASEATDGSVTDLVRNALALHRDVWHHRDAERLTRADANGPVVALTLGSVPEAVAERRGRTVDSR